MHPSPPHSADALLELLAPFWQGLIGACLLLTMAVMIIRLAQRGQSRMSTALLITGGAIVTLALVGMLFSG